MHSNMKTTGILIIAYMVFAGVVHARTALWLSTRAPDIPVEPEVTNAGFFLDTDKTAVYANWDSYRVEDLYSRNVFLFSAGWKLSQEFSLLGGGFFSSTRLPELEVEMGHTEPAGGFYWEQEAINAFFMGSPSRQNFQISHSNYYYIPLRFSLDFLKETDEEMVSTVKINLELFPGYHLSAGYQNPLHKISTGVVFHFHSAYEFSLEMSFPSTESPSRTLYAGIQYQWGKKIRSYGDGQNSNGSFWGFDPVPEQTTEEIQKEKTQKKEKRHKKPEHLKSKNPIPKKIPSFAVLVRWGLTPAASLRFQKSGEVCGMDIRSREILGQKGYHCRRKL